MAENNLLPFPLTWLCRPYNVPTMKQLSYAQKIKKLRDSNGWTQEQAATALGIAQATVSRLEQEEWTPSRPVQMHIDNLLASRP